MERVGLAWHYTFMVVRAGIGLSGCPLKGSKQIVYQPNTLSDCQSMVSVLRRNLSL